MVFVIGQVDYSSHVNWGSYQIDSEDEYEEWKDIGKRKHREYERSRCKGTVHLEFFTEQQYQSFLSNFRQSLNQDYLYMDICVYVSNKNTDQSFQAFVTKKAKVLKDVINSRLWADVTLSVEEI